MIFMFIKANNKKTNFFFTVSVGIINLNTWILKLFIIYFII